MFTITLFGFGCRPDGGFGFFEGPPFEILLVSSTQNFASLALVAGRLGFVALQPLRLAGDAAWMGSSAKGLLCCPIIHGLVPFRLLVCFGLAVVGATGLLVVETGFPRALLDGGVVSSESKMVDGDGILIFSIPRGDSDPFTMMAARRARKGRNKVCKNRTGTDGGRPAMEQRMMKGQIDPCGGEDSLERSFEGVN